MPGARLRVSRLELFDQFKHVGRFATGVIETAFGSAHTAKIGAHRHQTMG